MSTIAEKAREEGDAAEAEPTEPTEPTAPTEPEPEPAPTEPPAEPVVPPITPEEVEKRYKKAATASKAWFEKLAGILGPEVMARMTYSPLDTFPGLVEVDPQGQIEPGAKAETLALLGQEPPADYVQNPESSMCRRCQGYGDVLSGSKRKGNELVRCVECNGYGYNPAPTVVGQAIPALPAMPANGAQVPAPQVPHGPEDPRVAELRAAGYMVLPPAQTTP